jgi:Galactose oxidase-like, Early set domain
LKQATPNAQVFLVRGFDGSTKRYLSPTGTGSWTNGPDLIDTDREEGTSVMYLPGRVITIGGGFDGINPPLATAEWIDLTAATPTWQSAGTMANARRHANATLLANGHVLASGGTSAASFDDPAGAVLEAERWIPGNPGSWATMAAFADANNYRGYHSTALLLPDARVLSAGGNTGTGRPNMEIFWPPYLFQPNSNTVADRPIITAWPTEVDWGETFAVTIQTNPQHTIAQATFLRPGSVTHSVNMEQRFLQLTTQGGTGPNVQVTAPANKGDAPPGYYMLFLINNLGVPSVAKFIRLRDTPA